MSATLPPVGVEGTTATAPTAPVASPSGAGTGKTALVTGASSGLGLAIARRLVADGYRVAVTSRSEDRLKEAFPRGVEDGNMVFIAVDLAAADGAERCMAAVLEAFGGQLDVLINNAGAGVTRQHYGTPTAPASLDAMYALNVRAPFHLINLAAPALIAAQGVVVNLSSVAGDRPIPGCAAYCISKAAIDMVTKTAALELAPHRVRVVAVAPATFETHFHEAAGMSHDAAKGYYADSGGTHPLGRVGRPHEVAELVSFVVDNTRAGFMTGNVIYIDGGRLLTMPVAAGLTGK